MKTIDPAAQFERILVICTRQIGDVLLTTPLIHATRQRWPQARIDVVGFASTLGMLRSNPDVSELIELRPGGWWHAWPVIRRLWRRYDLALITQRSDREYLCGWLAARWRSGLTPGTGLLASWKRWILQHAVPDSEEALHVVVEKLRLLEPWMEVPGRIEVVAPLPQGLPADVEAKLRSRFAIVHIPSMWRFKRWPLASFEVLIQGLLSDGHQVVLTGGPSAQDRAQVASMRALAEEPDLLDLAGRLNFNQLSRLMDKAALFIGPDTSVTHLAAARDLPVIAIFGPTNPVVWGPFPQGSGSLPAFRMSGGCQHVGRVILLQGPQSCVPCRQEGCERHRQSRSECLESINPSHVLSLARQALAEPPARVNRRL